jgi:flotillin
MSGSPISPAILGIVGSIVLLILFVVTMMVRQYRRCPSNRILVVYGKVAGQRAARCLHGGGTLVIPLLQSYAYLNLEPMTIEIELKSALSKKNIRVDVPSTFTIGISTDPDIMNNAAERLLGLSDTEIAAQARDIILGQMRLVIATLSIEEINQDREKFLDLANKNVSTEVNKIGLELINVNIRDITDESGYIEALGQKAALEAINKAKVEVAEANRSGSIGHASAEREMSVEVANQKAQSVTGQKNAEQSQRIKVAKLEAGAVGGENESKAEIAAYEATLAERRAEANRRGEVALANASRDVLVAEKERELAKLEKEQIAQQIIERKKVEIEADAEAERLRRVAKGEADAVLAKYLAEAEGIRKVLDAKASGYEHLIRVCGDRKDLAPSLLIIEKLPDLIAEQVKAIQNLKIDKVTVWDSGSGENGNGATAGFLRGLIGALPPIHELAEQAGIDLPAVLGKVKETDDPLEPEPEDPAPTS